MRESFEITEQMIPDDVIEDLRERRGLEYDDTSEDEEILKMNAWSFLDEWLGWKGIIGYTSDIIEVVGYAFGIDLNQHLFDEAPKREV